MNNDMTERISSSIGSKVSTSMIVPKREPMENDFMLNNKRHFGEYLSNDVDNLVSNKRQLATKKNQHTDYLQSKLSNGNNDEQCQRQMDLSSTSNNLKVNNQKIHSDGGITDIPLSPSNPKSKPRYRRMLDNMTLSLLA